MVHLLDDSRIQCAKQTSLEGLYKEVSSCMKCPLSETRKKPVLYRGNPKAKLMIIGEGPGYHEDETGIPFVGRAGKLLDKILKSVAIDKDKDVYIANVVKCRPPGNRIPKEEEISKCKPYLDEQIKFVQPKIILLAGGTAMKSVLNVNFPISKMRGKWLPFENDAKVMPIFHPSYLLRNDSRNQGSPKWLMWQDIQEVKKQLDQLSS